MSAGPSSQRAPLAAVPVQELLHLREPPEPGLLTRDVISTALNEQEQKITPNTEASGTDRWSLHGSGERNTHKPAAPHPACTPDPPGEQTAPLPRKDPDRSFAVLG